MPDIARISAVINQQLQELESHRLDLRGSTSAVQLDQSRVGRLSRMDALQNQAMQLETMRRVERQIALLNGARKRLESEDFGYCRSCEEPVAEERLLMNPAVLFCISCAEKKERSKR